MLVCGVCEVYGEKHAYLENSQPEHIHDDRVIIASVST
jgi:hypothetical protein